MNSAPSEADLEDNMKPSPQKESTSVLDDDRVPLHFYDQTPCQFGISVQSFTPVSSANRKDKSRLAQIKARRRSNIGGRGSPETNSLIRFMAQQRMKNSPSSQTPELAKSTLHVPRVASSLRQKMAFFQGLMDEEESDGYNATPALDSNTEGCIKTRDYLSDGSSCGPGKENNPSETPTNSKRRRLGLLQSCNQEIKEAPAPTQHSSLKKQKVSKDPVKPDVTQGPLSSSGIVEPLEVSFSACSFPKKLQDAAYELQSHAHKDHSPAPSLLHSSSRLCIASSSSLIEMESTENSNRATPVQKKKQVHFGGPVSPEFFDKNLPPSTPLKKGGTPARAPTPGGSLQQRSVLKMSQQSQSKKPVSVFTIPEELLASPTLAFQCRPKEPSKIVFPSLEEMDSPDLNNKEYLFDVQPLNLNTSFFNDSSSQTATDFVTKGIDVPALLPEQDPHPEDVLKCPAPSGFENRREKIQPNESPAEELTIKAPTCSSSRKRKQPSQSEPVKRSTRSAARAASGKMKVTTTAVRRWNKGVDRSLYGMREYASKIPKLSPITEKLSVTCPVTCPIIAALQSPSVEPTVDTNPECAVVMILSQSEVSDSEGPKGTVSNVLEETKVADWQNDFNIEDVFKPVPTRGQRSVRRSLRNRSDAEDSSNAGLVWLPQTSPDNSKETRRRTRVRRHSAALPEHCSPRQESLAGDLSAPPLTSQTADTSLH